MWKYFWTYETDLPAGSGFDTFSATHLKWLAMTWLFIILASLLFVRLTPAAKRQTERVLAVLLAASYILRWIWAAVIGHYEPSEMLPFHLCALSALADVLAVYTQRSWLMDFGYSCGLPGSVAAFIIPGVGAYPLWHFNYLMFTVDHAILVLLPVVWILSGNFRPDFRNLPRCLGIVLVMAALDILVNRNIGSNFMFLTFITPNTPLTPFAQFFGNPGYQFVMALLLFLIWGMLYLPWVIAGRRGDHGNPKKCHNCYKNL